MHPETDKFSYKSRRLPSAGLIVAPLMTILWSTAHACPIIVTTQKIVNTTQQEVTVEATRGGCGGQGITLNYTKPDGTPGTASEPLLNNGIQRFKITAKAGTPIHALNTTENTTGRVTAVAFNPPQNQVESVYAISAGSSVTFGGDKFAVTGGYTVIDTAVDYNPASTDFGLESGHLSSLNVDARGPAGTIAFTLPGKTNYDANLAAIWAAPTLPATVTIPTSVEIKGMLSVDGMSTPFNGTLTDSTTYFDNGSQTDIVSLILATDFGPLSGTISATATPRLIPEPASWLILALSAPLTAILCRSRKRNSRREDVPGRPM